MDPLPKINYSAPEKGDKSQVYSMANLLLKYLCCRTWTYMPAGRPELFHGTTSRVFSQDVSALGAKVSKNSIAGLHKRKPHEWDANAVVVRQKI